MNDLTTNEQALRMLDKYQKIHKIDKTIMKCYNTAKNKGIYRNVLQVNKGGEYQGFKKYVRNEHRKQFCNS